MEIDFLKTKTYEEINDMFNHLNDKLKLAENKMKAMDEYAEQYHKDKIKNKVTLSVDELMTLVKKSYGIKYFSEHNFKQNITEILIKQHK